MTKKRIVWLLVTTALLALMIPYTVLAQDKLTQTFTASDSSFTFQYPDGWKLQKEVNGSVALKSVDTAITVYGPAALTALGVTTEPNNPVGTLDHFLSAKQIDMGAPQPAQVGNRTIARAEKTNGNARRIAYGVAFVNNDFAVMVITGPTASLTTLEPTLEAMVNTLNTPGAVQPSEPCTVSTDKGRTAAVRIGPGTNRTAIAFLTPNTDYTVLDQTTLKDGSKWWKLDKDQAAPNKSIQEAWVSQDQVVTKGGCDNLSGGVPPTQPPPTPATAMVPNGGTWTLTIGPDLEVDCGGAKQTTTLPPSSSTSKLFMTVDDDGSAIHFGTDTLTRTSPGVYSGQFDMSTQGMTAQVSLNVVSPDEMEGQIILNMTTCTGTTVMKLTHD